MNKGIGLATGELVGILNSDDMYTHADVIGEVVACMQDAQAESLYGDLQYVDYANTMKVVRSWKSNPFKREKFLSGWMPPHPTFFVKREVYERYGTFDDSFTCSADYELMIRFLYKYQVTVAYLPQFLVKMRTGGISNGSLKDRIRANQEDQLAWQKNDIRPPFYTRYLKPIRKIPQFFQI